MSFDSSDQNSEIHQLIGTPSFYPMDDDGFAISFDPFAESDMIKDSFNSYGFAVISAVISPSLIEYALERIYFWREKLSFKSSLFENELIELYHDKFLSDIRLSYRFYTAHSHIWKTSRLWSTFDRIQFQQSLNNNLNETDIRFKLSQNPHKHPKFSFTNGFISLYEKPNNNGNLMVLPNSNNYFQLWKSFLSPDQTNSNLQIEDCALKQIMISNSLVLPIKPGDGIIWDSRLIYGYSVNIESKPRISLQVSHLPAIMQDNIRQKRVESFVRGNHEANRSARLIGSENSENFNFKVFQKYRESENLDRFGRLIYGLEPY